MKDRPIEPLVLVDTEGKERKFLLSQGGYMRLKSQYGVKNVKGLMDKIAEEEDPSPLLFEALLDKGDETLDQFRERMPVMFTDMPGLTKLFRISSPDPRPTQAAPQAANETPTPTLTIVTGREIGDSPASASA